jgi:hypothetical protein
MRERGLLHAVIDALPDAASDEVSRSLAADCDDPVLRSLVLAPPENEEPPPRKKPSWRRPGRTLNGATCNTSEPQTAGYNAHVE